MYKRIYNHRHLLLMIIPALAFYLIFCYTPMYGIVLAFKEFQFNKSFGQMPWVGLDNFTQIFQLSDFWRVFRNTVEISVSRLLIEFPVPIILALALYEIKKQRLRKIYQTIFTFPHFLSWVLVVGVINGILSTDGVLNQLMISFGGERVDLLTNKDVFRPLLYITNTWKEAGWGTIIYLATLAGINPELYDAAYVDGANRFQRLLYISLPGIADVVIVLLLLNIGNMLNNGNFDQIVNLYNGAVQETSDIIDTYIFRQTFLKGESYSISTAIGLFKAVINLALLYSANALVKMAGREGIF